MLTTTTHHALRIIVVLAQAGKVSLTSERVAEAAAVPADYAVKVLQMLSRDKLVRARRGRGGGFQLARDPHDITLLDVIECVERQAARRSNSATRRPPGGPEIQRLEERLRTLHEAYRQGLKACTLAQCMDETAPTPTVLPVVPPAPARPARRP